MIEFRSFAKIFQSSDCGQILVQRSYDCEDEKPTISFSVYPQNTATGVCSTIIGFSSDDLADKMFEEMTPSTARRMIEPVLNVIARIQSDD